MIHSKNIAPWRAKALSARPKPASIGQRALAYRSLLGLLSFTWLGCGESYQQEPQALGSLAQALEGTWTFAPAGTVTLPNSVGGVQIRPAGTNAVNPACTEAQQAIEEQALRVGRIIAESPGYLRCIQQVVTTGIPDDADGSTWGPYSRQVGDPYDTEPNDLIAQRVSLEVRNNNDLRIHCDPDTSGTAGLAYANVEDNRFATEEMGIFSFFLDDRISGFPNMGRLNATQSEFFAHVPSAEWHEAMHQRRWQHVTRQDSIPFMTAECMEQVGIVQSTMCTEACPGELRAVSRFDQPGCDCVADPLVIHSMFERVRGRRANANEMQLIQADLRAGMSFAQLETGLRHPTLQLRSALLTVDGSDNDPAWLGIRRHSVDHPVINDTGDLIRTADVTATWRATYDEANLYFMVDVNDDAIVQDNAATDYHLDDSVEIYIDTDASGSTTYDGNDFQLGFRPGELVTHYGYLSAQPTTDPVVRSQVRQGGYRVEVGIPWSSLGGVAGGFVGLEVHVNDDDGAGRESQLAWATRSDNAWQDPSLFTPVAMPAALLPRAPGESITIDGIANETNWQTTAQPIARTPGSATSDSPGQWRATWSRNHLLLFVDVTDQAAIANDSASPWNDDGVEIYLDVNNNRGDYDDRDFQYIFRRNDPVVHLGAMSAQASAGILQATLDNSTGYALEAAIPWGTLGLTPESGLLVGLEVHINDDDDGGSRDGKRSWHSTTDESWRDTSTFGAIQLTGSPLPAGLGVFYTEQAPNIDGTQTGDIAWGAWAGPTGAIENLIIPGAIDSTATWRGLWDHDNLYLLVEVEEPAPPIADSGAAWWQDDSIELFLDPGYEHAQTYQSQDFHYIFLPSVQNSFVGSTTTAGHTVQVRSTTDGTGWTTEIAIPWSQLGAYPGVGVAIGLDLHVNDDEGGDREGKLAWALSELSGDVSWLNPQAFGQVVLLP